jgi:hypothetical protein
MIGYKLYRTTDIRRGRGHYAEPFIANILVGTNIVTVDVADEDCNFTLTAYNAKAESQRGNEAVYTYDGIVIPEPDPDANGPPTIPTGLKLVK